MNTYHPFRPQVSVTKGVIKIVSSGVLITLLSFLCSLLADCFGWIHEINRFIDPLLLDRKMVAMLFFVVFLLLLSVAKLNRVLIWCVHIYQKYASDDLRFSCHFEPTCSDYMILAIEKYGAVKGVYKGVARLLRCHNPNGGIDYP